MSYRSRRQPTLIIRPLIALSAVLMALSLGLPISAAELDREMAFHIPAQPLESALLKFSEQSGVQLQMASGDVPEQPTASLSERMAVSKALAVLLDRTGLTYQIVGESTAAIYRNRQVRSAGRVSANTLLASTMPTTLPSGSPDAQSPNTEPTEVLGEVLVTARRRTEDIQSVPISINVVSSDELRANNTRNVVDLQYLAPSINMYLYGEDPIISIRGQGGFNPGSSPAVVGYLNEIPLPVTAGSNTGAFFAGGFYDLESVQVLNGPQGTLFGRNTTGGAILFQTKRPTDRFEAYVDATVGNYDNRELEFALNVPVVDDKLLLRFSGRHQKRNGYTRTLGSPSHPNGLDLDNRDNWAGRVSMTLRAGDSFQSDSILDFYESDTHNSSSIFQYVTPGGVPEFLYPSVTDILAEQMALGARTQLPINIDQFSRKKQWSLTNITRFDVTEHLTLRNIFGFYKMNTSSTQDGDGTILEIFSYPMSYPVPTEVEQFSEELQLQGKTSAERLTWTTGIFLLHQPRPALDEYTYVVYGGTPYDTTLVSQKSVVDDSRALYAQATYDLSDIVLNGLKATAGYRYTWDERFYMNYPQKAICLTETRSPLCFAKFEAPSWTLALDYQITPETMLYGTIRRGYRAGGINSVAIEGFSNTFPSELVTDQEIGLKVRWNPGGIHAVTNVAVYHQEYDDINVTRTVMLPDGRVPDLTAAGASASIWGAEFEGLVVPRENLQLSGSVAWIELDHYDNFLSTLTPLDIARIEGYRLYQRPKIKYNLGVRYQLPVKSTFGDIGLAVNWAWQSRQGIESPPGTVDDPLKMQEAYGWLNLNVSWDGIGGLPLDTSLYVTNVLDKEVAYGATTVAGSIGFSTVQYLEPRMYGVRLRYRFGDRR